MENIEKEAEKRSKNYFKERCYKRNKWADAHDLENMWQDGAEFGYNKAKEDADNYSKMEQKFYDNLTEAKGLLTGFISKMKHTVHTPYEKDLIERAEQFLRNAKGE